MSSKATSVLLWIFAFVFMSCIAIYQRMTGPTYPVKAKVTIGNQEIKGKLLTSSDSEGDAIIEITAPDTAIKGTYQYRRFKSNDEWTVSPLKRQGEMLIAALPHQAPAGKVMYEITLEHGGQQFKMHETAVVLRYKGKVPLYILIPHILLMFLAMVFSTRTGVEAIAKRENAYTLAIWTVIFLFCGGVILGPIVQKFAFGVYWSGWPLGHDLTDNKTAIALIGWLIAIFKLRKNPTTRGWVIAACLILLAIYLIPHSVLGSEIDYSKVAVK